MVLQFTQKDEVVVLASMNNLMNYSENIIWEQVLYFPRA